MRRPQSTRRLHPWLGPLTEKKKERKESAIFLCQEMDITFDNTQDPGYQAAGILTWPAITRVHGLKMLPLAIVSFIIWISVQEAATRILQKPLVSYTSFLSVLLGASKIHAFFTRQRTSVLRNEAQHHSAVSNKHHNHRNVMLLLKLTTPRRHRST